MGESVQTIEEVVYTPTSDLTFERLLEEVKIELFDARYLHLTHGRASTYNKGCRGHLCNYRNRTRRREAHREAMQAKLPNGVVPGRRSRQEQYWDSMICQITVMKDMRDALSRYTHLLKVAIDLKDETSS